MDTTYLLCRIDNTGFHVPVIPLENTAGDQFVMLGMSTLTVAENNDDQSDVHGTPAYVRAYLRTYVRGVYVCMVDGVVHVRSSETFRSRMMTARADTKTKITKSTNNITVNDNTTAPSPVSAVASPPARLRQTIAGATYRIPRYAYAVTIGGVPA